MDEDAPSEEAQPPATKADRAAARKRLHRENWRKQRVSIDACTIGDSCRVAYGRCDLDNFLDCCFLYGTGTGSKELALSLSTVSSYQ